MTAPARMDRDELRARLRPAGAAGPDWVTHEHGDMLAALRPGPGASELLAARAELTSPDAVAEDLGLLGRHWSDRARRPLIEPLREQAIDRFTRMVSDEYALDTRLLIDRLCEHRDDVAAAFAARLRAYAPARVDDLIARAEPPFPEQTWAAAVNAHEHAFVDTIAPLIAAGPRRALIIDPQAAEIAGDRAALAVRYRQPEHAERLARRVHQEAMGLTGNDEDAAEAIRIGLRDDLTGARAPEPHAY